MSIVHRRSARHFLFSVNHSASSSVKHSVVYLFGQSVSKLPAFFSGTTFHDSGLKVRGAGTTESEESIQKTQACLFRHSECKYILCIFWGDYFFMLQGSKCVEQAQLNGN